MAAPPETAKASPRAVSFMINERFLSQKTMIAPKIELVTPSPLLKQSTRILRHHHKTLIIRPEETELFKATPP